MLSMSDSEVNIILTKYDKVICSAINKMNLNYAFLDNRCITKDDLLQEVRISLWKLLKDTYDPEKTDIETFLNYQAVWNARMFLRNLKKSARCFTGTKSDTKKSGSMQARIDDNKLMIFDIHKNNKHTKPDESIGEKDDTDTRLNDFYFSDNEIEVSKLDSSIDYDLLVKKVLSEMTKLNFTHIHKDIFIFMAKNLDSLNDKDFLDNIRIRFKIKNINKTKKIVNRIKEIIKNVM